jgi:hypothetical protein
LGHINLVSQDIQALRASLVALKSTLPHSYYPEAIEWSLKALNSVGKNELELSPIVSA